MWTALPLTFLAVVLNRQIASQSWTRISKESAICCHLAGLQPVTLAWKASISDQHFRFAFTATTAQMKIEKQKGQEEQYHVSDF